LLDQQPTADSKWLNYGCGNTYTSELLSNFCGKVFAYDLDASVYGTDTDAITYGYPFHHQYDAIFLIEVIEHLRERKAVALLRELKHLRTFDNLLVSTPIVEQTNHKPTNKHHQIEYSLQDFTDLINKVGLSIVDSDLFTTTFTDGETKQQGIFKIQ
jgi:2-polyprenyl-3-methyl-5-hydroxy-6-metoxy-1,4-benzoquinol methylase